jgi:hypothetical protein
VFSGIVLAMTRGQGMALMGLVLGPAFFLATRFGRPSTGPVGRARDDGMRWTAIPLIVVGMIGLIFWAFGH